VHIIPGVRFVFNHNVAVLKKEGSPYPVGFLFYRCFFADFFVISA
jgi:hypothetical protein